MQKELEAIEFPSSEGGEDLVFTKRGIVAFIRVLIENPKIDDIADLN